jgi:hypothetical protein
MAQDKAILAEWKRLQKENILLFSRMLDVIWGFTRTVKNCRNTSTIIGCSLGSDGQIFFSHND